MTKPQRGRATSPPTPLPRSGFVQWALAAAKLLVGFRPVAEIAGVVIAGMVSIEVIEKGIRPMQMGATAWFAVLAVTSTAFGAGVSPISHAEIVYHTVFLNDTAKKWEDLPIRRPIGDRVLRLIPETVGTFEMIDLNCKQINARGQLRECKTELDPKSDRLQAVANAAVKDLRIDKAYARYAQSKLRFVSIQIRVSKSLGPVMRGPCWPPSCILEPAPPPPPPTPAR